MGDADIKAAPDISTNVHPPTANEPRSESSDVPARPQSPPSPKRPIITLQDLPDVISVPDDGICQVNQTMFQGFEWYCPPDQQHWNRLAMALPELAMLGVTSMWIPPATKAATPYTNGYDIYDLWDLGEFDQKGTIPTKWGSKLDLTKMVDTANKNGVGILFEKSIQKVSSIFGTLYPVGHWGIY